MIWAEILLLAAAQGVAPLPDLLVCQGATVASLPTGQTSAIVTDNSGNVVTGRAHESQLQRVEAVMQFRLNGDDPRVNMPRLFAPEIASSKGGWYRIKDLEVSDDSIRGKVSFNFAESSRFEIDRRTGVLTSSKGFQASCVPVDVSERKF